MVFGRGWSRDHTWVRLMGLKMCVGLSHLRCYFKNTTFFLLEKKLGASKVRYRIKKRRVLDGYWMWVVT